MSILHTMISGISSVLKQYSTGGRPSDEGMTVKRALLTAICSELDPSQCSLASKLLGVKSETLTDHSNLSHKIATGEESMIVCRGKERSDAVSQETIDFVTRFWINSSKPAPGKSDFKKNPHDKSKEERIYYAQHLKDCSFRSVRTSLLPYPFDTLQKKRMCASKFLVPSLHPTTIHYS